MFQFHFENPSKLIDSFSLRNLRITFPQSAPVIKNLDLSFKRGKSYLLTGPTASGKSTVLRFLKGLVPLFYPATISGILEVNGKQVTLEEFWEYRTEIGYLFQDPSLQVIGSTVAKDIAFGLENLAIPASIMNQKVSEMANGLDISALLTRSTAELSGGELALVALASILVLEPQILLLDEFTTYLDKIARRNVLSVIKKVQSPDRIIIVVSHQITEFLPLVDEIIVLNDGKVLLQRPTGDFISSNLKEVEKYIRIPEFYEIGVKLCQKKRISPRFQTVTDLFKLLKVKNLDHS